MSAIGHIWTPAEDDILIEGITEGDTYNIIAARLPGVSARQARQRADTLGIKPIRLSHGEVIDQRPGSRALLEEMEAAFRKYAKAWGVDYLDARTLLMNAEAL